MTEPTPQPTLHPWRRVVRTIVAAIPLAPLVVAELGVGSVPWIAGFLTFLGAATRVLANKRVDDWLREYVPWLSSTPRQ